MLTLHVAISLCGIVVGAVVVYGLLRGRVSPTWMAAFFIVHALTSLTGFPLEPFGFDPPRVIGILALVLLGVAAAAYYGTGLRAYWRVAFIVTTLLVLYFDVFVGVIQAFQKVDILKRLAPTQSEAPFIGAQVVVLVLLAGFCVTAVKRYHPSRSDPRLA